MPVCEINGYRFAARILYRAEQDIPMNRTTVHITGVEMRTLWSNVVGSCWVTGSISINGMHGAELRLSNTESCGIYMTQEFSGGGEETWGGFQSTDVTVEHLADGSGGMKLQAELIVRLTNGTILDPGISAAVTEALPTIPRVSQAVAAPAALGQEMVIRLARAADRFWDTVRWRCGTASGTIAAKSAQEEFRFVPPLELANQAPNREYAAVTITVTSFDGNTEVGSREITVACPIPAEIVPTLEVTVSDRMGYEAAHGGYIQTQSQARIQTTAAGAYGSTVTDISVRCGALNGSGADAVFALEDSGTIPIAVTVTDSRGRKATKTASIEVLAYRMPAVTIREAYRCDAEGNSQPDGIYLRLVFDAEVTAVRNGTASYRAVRQIHGTQTRSEVLLTDYAGSLAVKGGSVVLPAGVDSGYDCFICVTDSFQTVQSPGVLVPVAFVLLDMNRNGRAVGIGMRAKTAGMLCIGLDADLEEHRIGNLAAPQNDRDAATKGYVDSQLRALRQALGLE